RGGGRGGGGARGGGGGGGGGARAARRAGGGGARAQREGTAAGSGRARAAARLAVARGGPPDEPLTVDAEEQVGFAGDTEEAFVARALAARPDLAAAREERARFETEASLARRRGRVPNPILRGFYREERSEEHT